MKGEKAIKENGEGTEEEEDTERGLIDALALCQDFHFSTGTEE